MTLNEKFESYVIEMIKNSCFVEDNNYTINSDKGCIQLFFSVYQKEYGWSFPNIRNVTEYLQGLPSIADIDFYNYRILEIGKEWNVILDSERAEDRWVDLWFNRVASAIFRLADKYHIDPAKYTQKKIVRW